MKATTLKATFLAASALAFAGTVQADIAGSLWRVPEVISQNAIPANVPGTTPFITFSVSSPFNFDATGASVATWLASGSAYNITENTPRHFGFPNG